MTPTQAKWLDDMETLFQSPGWQTFVDDQKGYLDAIANAWRSHKTFDSYTYDKGRAEVHESIVNLPKLVEAVRKSLPAEMEPEEEPDA